METNRLRRRVIGAGAVGFCRKSGWFGWVDFLARFLSSVRGLVSVSRAYCITASCRVCRTPWVIDHKGVCCVG